MSTQPTREEELFHEALELPSGPERSAFLEKACAGDGALRRAVEELLQADAEAGTVLNPVVSRLVPEPATAPVTEKPGDRIGRYKLLQVIGEGGFGVVYMAEQQEPVRRRVALKIIKLGMDTKQVVARFEAERQALAMMDHPNIARVFDGGATETGRPYFVMELVRGVPITEYCDQHKLSMPQRLNLFMPICQAIQHAHQKGVIHRDIKPSNILVMMADGVPVPKVIDFGIAKAIDQPLTEKTVFTRFEQFIGTPAYMSPEQAGLSGLDIDTRSDIYALGVLLYELLTGKTPFDPKHLQEAGLDEIRRIIREDDPPRPSTRISTLVASEQTAVANCRGSEPPKLIHMVRGDLDWIVMKAMEKDRTRRYETANGLAMDITRFLTNEPIAARPPSNLYRLRKLVRRNKLAFAAAATVMAVLIIGLGVSTWEYLKERQARRRAVAAEEKTKTEAEKSQQVAQFLKEMLQGVGPSVALGRDTTMLREILDKTAERVGKDLTNQPEVEAELRNTIGRAYEDLGVHQKAEEMHRGALAIRRRLFGNEHPVVAESLLQLCYTLWRQSKLADAEMMGREAVAVYKNQHGGEDSGMGRALDQLASVLERESKTKEAEAAASEALRIQRKLAGTNDNEDLVYALGVMERTLYRQGKLPEAEALIREGLAIQERLGDFGASVWRLENLATVLASEGKSAEAEVAIRKAVTITKQFKDDDARAWNLRTLGLVLANEGKLAEAEAAYREDLQFVKSTFDNAHPSFSAVLTGLADTLYLQGRFAEAETMYRRALASRRSELGNEMRTAELHNAMATVLRAESKLNEAEVLARECLAICEEKVPDDWRTFDARRLLGGILLEQKKYIEAEPLLLSGYEGMKQRLDRLPLYSNPHLKRALQKQALEELVQLYEATGRPDQAAEWKKMLEETTTPIPRPTSTSGAR